MREINFRNLTKTDLRQPANLKLALANIDELPYQLYDHYQLMYLAVKLDGLDLRLASPRLQANEKLVQLAVSQNYQALQYADYTLRDQLSLAEAWLKQDTRTYPYLSERLRQDVNLACLAVKLEPELLSKLANHLRDNYQVVKLAIQGKAAVWSQASARLKDNLKLAKLALANDVDLLKHASRQLRHDRQLMDYLYQLDPANIIYWPSWYQLEKVDLLQGLIRQQPQRCWRISSWLYHQHLGLLKTILSINPGPIKLNIADLPDFQSDQDLIRLIILNDGRHLLALIKRYPSLLTTDLALLSLTSGGQWSKLPDQLKTDYHVIKAAVTAGQVEAGGGWWITDLDLIPLICSHRPSWFVQIPANLQGLVVENCLHHNSMVFPNLPQILKDQANCQRIALLDKVTHLPCIRPTALHLEACRVAIFRQPAACLSVLKANPELINPTISRWLYRALSWHHTELLGQFLADWPVFRSEDTLIRFCLEVGLDFSLINQPQGRAKIGQLSLEINPGLINQHFNSAWLQRRGLASFAYPADLIIQCQSV